MIVALVDYGAGNLHSARRALERGLLAAGLTGEVRVTADPGAVARADRVVLPGDGAFADCAANLRAVPGLVEALEEAVRGRGAPFLGICVGMQLLATVGREDGDAPGLGWVPGEVARLAPSDPALKVPHIGWNTLEPARPHALTEGVPLGPAGRHAYFLHAYALAPEDPADLVASAAYGGAVAAIVARGNVAGTQFHPEKSQALGLALLANFLRWSP